MTVPAGVPPVEIWWAHEGDAAPGLRALLAPPELDRLDRYRLPATARRYLAGRALLRLALGRRLGLPPEQVPLDSSCAGCGGPHGRPRLPARLGPWNASVSHAGVRIGVAVGRGRLGLDVAAHDAALDLTPDSGLVDRALAPIEARALLRLPGRARPGAFARVWARKEAVLKACDVGLSRPPSRLIVTPADEPADVRAAPPELRFAVANLTLRDLERAPTGPGYAVALAHESAGPDGAPPPLRTRDGSALLATAARTNPANPPHGTRGGTQASPERR
ncbi:4'-phosphopantetheinyl transferase [Streptomyces zhaozhouensis]|uniref:4'-phosphopantetheinyl transferase n=1 Tax=Streptomyces zhaozhouensis TaxID=1300267 RepID=A0A286E0V4_9ACTN|nr:4'-phosphopantetheinyl transferase superfamily protein [Streptomyces zhaozhouensis]SOD64505.1 4'-phosphopantetheinyl transferase [Streptomyces zhaozhouensis]